MKPTRNVSAGEIADVLRMWIASRGNLNLAELLQVPPQWLYVRKMPKAADLLKFQDIALMFVRVAPSLKLGQTNCYDAMLQVEQHDTPHNGTSNVVRTRSALLRKILECYRALAMYPGKRDRVYRYASKAEAAALNAVCGLVDRCDDAEPMATGAAPPFPEHELTPPSLKRSRSYLSTSSAGTFMKRSLADQSIISVDSMKRSCSEPKLPVSEHRIVLAQCAVREAGKWCAVWRESFSFH